MRVCEVDTEKHCYREDCIETCAILSHKRPIHGDDTEEHWQEFLKWFRARQVTEMSRILDELTYHYRATLALEMKNVRIT